MQDFTRLRVWQRAQDFTVDVHRESDGFDARRCPGLRSQLRRATASISANIAEGASQPTAPLHARHLGTAIASAGEVQDHLATSFRLGVLDEAAHRRLDAEIRLIRRMLIALYRRVKDG